MYEIAKKTIPTGRYLLNEDGTKTRENKEIYTVYQWQSQNTKVRVKNDKFGKVDKDGTPEKKYINKVSSRPVRIKVASGEYAEIIEGGYLIVDKNGLRREVTPKPKKPKKVKSKNKDGQNIPYILKKRDSIMRKSKKKKHRLLMRNKPTSAKFIRKYETTR